MNPESFSSRVRSVANLCADYDQRKTSSGTTYTMVAHAGAIALGIASISEVFRTIFLPNLVDTVMNLHRQDGGPSIFPFVGLRREEIEPFFKDSGV